MQKVLLASTALVMSTGWAMADVTNAGDGVGATIRLSGEAKMGVVGNDADLEFQFDGRDILTRDSAAQFFTDIDLKWP